MKKIGLTLGGGGAKGFAHIAVLEVFDELGIKPAQITGASIGAILGALYASKHTARDIGQMIDELIIQPSKTPVKGIFRNRDMFKFIQLMDPQFSLKPKGLIKGDKLLQFLYEQLGVDTFEELSIPLKAVATDFWRKEQVVFSKGDLMLALRATMAIPFVFTPVTWQDRILVDGGIANPVPLDLLSTECDIRIAVDIMGQSTKPKTKIPSPMESMFSTYEVMQGIMAKEKLTNYPVDIYLQPPITDIEMLDFYKAERICKQGRKAKDDFKRQLERLLEDKASLNPKFWKKD